MKIQKFLKNRKFLSLEFAYIFIVLIWGSIMVFLIPPFQSPDEPAHYFRAIGIMQGKFKCEEENRYEIPENVFTFVESTRYKQIAFHPERKFDWGNIQNAGDIDWNGSKVIHMPLCYSFSIPHLIPGSILKISSIIGLNLFDAFLLARWVNLLIATLITACAIRLIPFAKHAVFALGVLPMTVFQYSTINYDAFFIPMIFLFIAYCLNLYTKEKKLTLKEKIFLVLLSICATIVKSGYQPLLLIIFILFPKRKEYRKEFILFAAVFIAINAFLFLLQGKLLPMDLEFSGGVSASGQIDYILSHPFSYIIVLARTLYHYGFYYVKSYLGYLGWLDYTFHWGIYGLIIISAFAFIFLEKARVNISRNARIILLSAFILTYLLVHTALYAINTKVGELIVIGVQGRYFIGASLAFIIALLPKGYSVQKQNVRKYLLVFITTSLLLVVLATIIATYKRYYL